MTPSEKGRWSRSCAVGSGTSTLGWCSLSDARDRMESFACPTPPTYVALYIYIHTYIPVYIHTYIHIYINTYIHIYINTQIHFIHIYVYTYIHIYIHTYTFIHIHSYKYIHTYIHSYIYIQIHLYLYVYTDTDMGIDIDIDIDLDTDTGISRYKYVLIHTSFCGPTCNYQYHLRWLYMFEVSDTAAILLGVCLTRVPMVFAWWHLGFMRGYLEAICRSTTTVILRLVWGIWCCRCKKEIGTIIFAFTETSRIARPGNPRFRNGICLRCRDLTPGQHTDGHKPEEVSSSHAKHVQVHHNVGTWSRDPWFWMRKMMRFQKHSTWNQWVFHAVSYISTWSWKGPQKGRTSWKSAQVSALQQESNREPYSCRNSEPWQGKPTQTNRDYLGGRLGIS